MNDPRASTAWSASLGAGAASSKPPTGGCDATERVVDVGAYKAAETARCMEAEKDKQKRAMALNIGRVRAVLPQTATPWVDAKIDRDRVTNRTVARVNVRHPEASTPNSVRLKRAEALAAMLPMLRRVACAQELADRVAEIVDASASVPPGVGDLDAPGYISALLVMRVRDIIERDAMLCDVAAETLAEHVRCSHAGEVDVLSRSVINKAIENGRQGMLESIARRLQSGELKPQIIDPPANRGAGSPGVPAEDNVTPGGSSLGDTSATIHADALPVRGARRL